ncbi:hypothetical protein [Amycolatopsis sp. lyj-108]|uniref:hypothetical protein n=1 Tax=Amycolatopsis sp. lyj-108 TaxID=2789286 RepID=UPI003977EE2C
MGGRERSRCLIGIVNAESAKAFSYRANRMVFSGPDGVLMRTGKRLQTIMSFHEPIAVPNCVRSAGGIVKIVSLT